MIVITIIEVSKANISTSFIILTEKNQILTAVNFMTLGYSIWLSCRHVQKEGNLCSQVWATTN